MTTTSTKHQARDYGNPPMTYTRGSTLLDDMEIVRKLCLAKKHDLTATNSSHLSFGISKVEPPRSLHQSDYGVPSHADVEPKSNREARSLAMNSRHFEMGFNTDVPLSQSQMAFVNHPRDAVRDPFIHFKGRPSARNESALSPNATERANWADDLQSSKKIDYLPHNLTPSHPSKNHRINHFIHGSDPANYETHYTATFAPHEGFVRQPPVKSNVIAVAIGSRDFPWHKEAQSTNRRDYQAPCVGEDSLTDFLKKVPPFTFGDNNDREMLTENRGAFKRPEFVDCSNLTAEQLQMLGVSREQILPRKVPLSFLSSHQVFENSLGFKFGSVLE